MFSQPIVCIFSLGYFGGTLGKTHWPSISFVRNCDFLSSSRLAIWSEQLYILQKPSWWHLFQIYCSEINFLNMYIERVWAVENFGNYLVALFENIFSHCELSFYFVYGLLCCTKGFEFNYVLFVYISSYFYFSIFTSLRGGSEKILQWFMPESVLPMYSSKSFIVFSL